MHVTSPSMNARAPKCYASIISISMRANVAFVVRPMAVEYFAPARLDNLLQVESEIVSLKRASLTFAQRILMPTGGCSARRMS